MRAVSRQLELTSGLDWFRKPLWALVRPTDPSPDSVSQEAAVKSACRVAKSVLAGIEKAVWPGISEPSGPCGSCRRPIEPLTAQRPRAKPSEVMA